MIASIRAGIALVAAVVWAGAAAAASLSFLTEENPPFNYTENGKIVGSATEIVQQVSARSGHPATIEMLPWDTAYVRAQAERNTCVFATARLENRERLFLWVGPLGSNLWALYGKSDFAVPIRTLKDLAPYRIGAVTRDAKGEFLRENAITNLKFVRDDRDNPPRLLLPSDNPDHIDLWITSFYAGRSIAKAARVADVKLVFIAAEQPLYLACNPQTDRNVVKALSDALETLRADGSLARINALYEKKFKP
jgi:polar amino acid transport system substrate-binding protein